MVLREGERLALGTFRAGRGQTDEWRTGLGDPGKSRGRLRPRREQHSAGCAGFQMTLIAQDRLQFRLATRPASINRTVDGIAKART
jgi:hypothetical protein